MSILTKKKKKKEKREKEGGKKGDDQNQTISYLVRVFDLDS